MEETKEKEGAPKARKAGRRWKICYIAAVVGICLIPFAAIGFRATTQTTENKRLAELPVLTDENGVNQSFLADAGEWFADHFAFRQELVAADAKIRSALFGVSAADNVIQGKNGWLYYEATLDDFQHRNGVSERMLFNMAHNMALMQEYTQLLGKTFVFTIAPNKNSLYGENMPERYKHTIADKSDAERLIPWLEKEGVNYVDLFSLFEGQDEVLYYARDSHWNQKGALLVYNALLDACSVEHDTWETEAYDIVCDYYGDLNRMLYPVWARPEDDIHFERAFTYRYGRDGVTVEDTLIQTSCEQRELNLLMYRDSFGNSLLPYMAEQFANATFSKVVPYPMTDLVTAEPDVVIVEKVERHLPTLGEVPPLMSAMARRLEGEIVPVQSGASFSVKKEGSYLKMSGIVQETYMEPEGKIYVEVDDGEGASCYEAFCVRLTENGTSSDYGYLLYLSGIAVKGEELTVRVLTGQQDRLVALYEGRAENPLQ